MGQTKKPVTKTKTTKKGELASETPEAKIAEISTEIVKVQKQAEGIVVTTKVQYEEASVFLSSVVKPRVNRIKELLDFFNNPHKKARAEALDAMRKNEALFEAQLKPLTTIETSIKNAMSAYLRAEDEKARKEEARLAALREKQDNRREDKGLAPIAAPLPTIARSEATVHSMAGGKTTAKKVWKHEITDLGMLANDAQFARALHQYCTENDVYNVVLRKMVTAGVREVGGVRIYEDFEISASGARA